MDRCCYCWVLLPSLQADCARTQHCSQPATLFSWVAASCIKIYALTFYSVSYLSRSCSLCCLSSLLVALNTECWWEWSQWRLRGVCFVVRCHCIATPVSNEDRASPHICLVGHLAGCSFYIHVHPHRGWDESWWIHLHESFSHSGCPSLLKCPGSTFMPLNYISTSLSLWMSSADREEAAPGKSRICNPTNETHLPYFQLC